MPTKGNPRRAFRLEDSLWAAFLAAVKRDPGGRKGAEVVRDFVSWYARQPKAPSPKRPDAE